MRERLSQNHPESPLLLYVGRLSAEKEIERIKPILEAIPDARLALVGDVPHRQNLEKHFAGYEYPFCGISNGTRIRFSFC